MVSFKPPTKQEAADWRRIFSLIDSSIEQFSVDHRFRLTRWRWEYPNRVLSPSRRSEQAIQVDIKGDPGKYDLVVRCLARDKDKFVDQIPIPYQLEDTEEFLELRRRLRTALEQASAVIDGW